MMRVILNKKEEFEQFLSEYPELRKEFEQLNKQDQDIIRTIYDFLKTSVQQSEHKIYQELKFNIFIRKFPRLKEFIENVRNLEKVHDFRYDLIKRWYNYLSYLGFDNEDIYRIIEIIILDYGGNPQNIYTEKEIYTPKILRAYFPNVIKSRPWHFKPETDADNEVYNNYKTFKKIIYADPRFKLVSRDFRRQRNPKTPKDYIRQIINKYRNPDLTSFQLIANINELVEYVSEVVLKLLEPDEFDKIFTFEAYSSDVDWAIIPGFIINVIPEKGEIIVSYMVTKEVLRDREKSNFAVKLRINRDGLKISSKEELLGLEIVALSIRVSEKCYKPLLILTNGNRINFEQIYTYAYIRSIIKAITEVVIGYYGDQVKRILKTRNECWKLTKDEKMFRELYRSELRLLTNKFILKFFMKYKNIYKIIPPVVAYLIRRSGSYGRSIALDGELMNIVECIVNVETSRIKIPCSKCKDKCMLYQKIMQNNSVSFTSLNYTNLVPIYINPDFINNHQGSITRKKQDIFIAYKENSSKNIFYDKLKLVEKDENKLFAKFELEKQKKVITAKFKNKDEMYQIIRLLTRSYVLGEFDDNGILLFAMSDKKPLKVGEKTRIGLTYVETRLNEIIAKLQTIMVDDEVMNSFEICPYLKKLINEIATTGDISILNRVIFGSTCLETLKFNTLIILYLIKRKIISSNIKLRFVLLPPEITQQILNVNDEHIFLIIKYKGSKIVIDSFFYSIIDPDELEKAVPLNEISKEVNVIDA